MTLDRTVDGLTSIVHTLETEVGQARPSSHVALTALQAIESYPATIWRDSDANVHAVITIWERCEQSEIRDLANRLLARFNNAGDPNSGLYPPAGEGLNHV